MRFEVTKCHGSGNDFPMIDARDIVFDDSQWASVARALADRNGPVGGDGLLLLTRGGPGHDFGMRMFNSDGSEAETCLNGLRCVARAGFEALGIDHARVALKTSSADVARDPPLAPFIETVKETVGPASLDITAWPMVGITGHIVDTQIALLPSDRCFTAVAMPNPHLVSFVDRVNDEELRALGVICEAAPGWLPNRANMSFVEVRSGDLFVRTFERGVGLTNSCGSAMAASCYAACLTGRTPFGMTMTIFNRGGMVRGTADIHAVVTLSGNATFEWAAWVEVAGDKATTLTVTRRYDDEGRAWNDLVQSLD